MHAADIKKCGADFLGRNLLAMFAVESESVFVVGDRCLQVFDGNTEVIYFVDHKFSGFERVALCLDFGASARHGLRLGKHGLAKRDFVFR